VCVLITHCAVNILSFIDVFLSRMLAFVFVRLKLINNPPFHPLKFFIFYDIIILSESNIPWLEEFSNRYYTSTYICRAHKIWIFFLLTGKTIKLRWENTKNILSVELQTVKKNNILSLYYIIMCPKNMNKTFVE